MKNKLFLLFWFCTVIGYSQSNNQRIKPSKVSFDLALKMQKSEYQNKQIAVLIKGDVNHIHEVIESNGGHFKFSAGDIASVSIPVSALQNFMSDEKIKRIEQASQKLKTLNDSMLVHNNIIPVHNGMSPLPQGYDGSGVVLGFIDTGIDYPHRDFRDSLGNTRVKFIWDQTLANAANTPQPYNYGQEITEADINSELQGGPITGHYDVGSHGTHVTGIGAGNGLATGNYKGVAPKADIISVKVDLTLADDVFLSNIVDAVNYIFQRADSLGEPCSINISLGTYFGSHDGRDLTSQAINNMITAHNGRVVTCAAGNIGYYPFHVQLNPTSSDTVFVWNRYEYYNNNPPYFEIWADTADFNQVQLSFGADQRYPSYEFRGAIPFSGIGSHLNIDKFDTIYSTLGNRLAVVETYAERIGNQYAYYGVVWEDSSLNWRISATGNGSFDAYSFGWIPQDSVPSDTVFSPIVNYVAPDVNQNICSSFQCSDKIITVGQYVNRNSWYDVADTLHTLAWTVGALSTISSHGPTRDGRIKPDITSTGDVTMSCIVTWRIPATLTSPNYWWKMSQDTMHIVDGGTSSASPVIAGIAALYFQKNPNASWQDVKDHILNCAAHDTFTGTNLPDNWWGYGKADAFAALVGCSFVGLEKNEIKNEIYCYPNPFNNTTTIHLDERNSDVQLTISDATGRIVKRIVIPKNTSEYRLQNLNLNAGVYYFSVGNIVAKKMVVM